MLYEKFVVPQTVSKFTFKTFLSKYFAWLNSINPKFNDSIVLDFHDCTFLSPVAMVFFSSQTDSFVERGIKVHVIYKGDSNVSKFLRLFGIVRIPTVEDAYERSMKNHVVEVHRCRTSAEGLHLANKIIPHVLRRTNCKESTAAAINWALWEIFDNAGCHGYGCYLEPEYPKPVYVSAFSYQQEVEVAILDRGQGVFESLFPKYPDLTARTSLKAAIVEGVSGHPQGSPGFGLYGTSEIARRGAGTFFLWSSGYGIKVSSSGDVVFASPGIEGTIVTFSLNGQMEAPFEEILNKSPRDFFDDLEI